jgi:hypothetical protein
MNATPSAGRGVGMIETIRRLDPGTILTTILVLGLVLRVFIAGVYLPISGFAIDIGDFSAWGQRMASVGPGDFYEEGYFATTRRATSTSCGCSARSAACSRRSSARTPPGPGQDPRHPGRHRRRLAPLRHLPCAGVTS